MRNIRKNGQAGRILLHLQRYPHKVIDATYFMGGQGPFVGYSASARLSELKKEGLVVKAGSIGKGRSARDLYRITIEGQNYFVQEIKITKDTPPLYFERVDEVKKTIVQTNTNKLYLFIKALGNILKI